MIPPMNFMRYLWTQAHWGPDGIPDGWRSPQLAEPPGDAVSPDSVIDYVTGRWYAVAPVGLIPFLRQVDGLGFGEADSLYAFDFHSWGEFQLAMSLLAIHSRVDSWERLPAHWLTVLAIGLYPKWDHRTNRYIIGLPIIRHPNVRTREIPDFLRAHYERTFG